MGRAFDIVKPRRINAAKFLGERGTPNKSYPRKSFKLGGIFEFIILAAIVTVLASYFGKAVKSTLQTSDVSENGGLPTLSTENIQDNTNKNAENSQTVAQAGNDQTASAVTAITKENAKIKILNGAGVPSLAAETRDKLTKAGFKITSIGNAKNKYTSTYVYYKNGAKDIAEEIGKLLANRNPKVQESTVAQENDVIVVMGSQ